MFAVYPLGAEELLLDFELRSDPRWAGVYKDCLVVRVPDKRDRQTPTHLGAVSKEGLRHLWILWKKRKAELTQSLRVGDLAQW